MLCPSCGSNMSPESYGGLAIDVCDTCSGVWFDEGELGKFLHLEASTQDALVEKHDSNPQNVDHFKRLCPQCQQVLESYKYAYTSPVIIDSCPGCHGVFVDQGEVAQIEKFVADSAKMDPQSELAMATAELDAGIDRSRQRALRLARSVWTRRMTGSYAWWMLGLDQDTPR